MKKPSKRSILLISGATAITLLMAGPAFAATNSTTGKSHTFQGVIGTVSAVNGTTLIVTNKAGVAYTVNTASAVVQKGRGKSATPLALSSITVNDKVAVKGAVSGTIVTATKIDERVGGYKRVKMLSANAAFGTVTAVNGSTITLAHKTKDNTTNVTVTTTGSTTYQSKGAAVTSSDVTVGERIVAMGTKDSSGNVSDATTVRIFEAKK